MDPQDTPTPEKKRPPQRTRGAQKNVRMTPGEFAAFTLAASLERDMIREEVDGEGFSGWVRMLALWRLDDLGVEVVEEKIEIPAESA